MTTILAIALGGALGAVSRYGVTQLAMSMTPQGAPLATLAVNIIGCGVMGLIFGLVTSGNISLTEAQRGFILIGFLGALTTFSAFSLDVFTLIEKGAHLTAIAYTLASVGLSLGAFLLLAKLATTLIGSD